MAKLLENDWYFLNNLIYKIYSIADFDEMRQTIIELLGIMIPNDKSTFYLAGNDGKHYLKDPVNIGFTKEALDRYFYEFEEIDFMKWIYPTAANKAFRQTDLFDDAVRHSMPYYQKAYVPENIEFVAILSLSYNDSFMGVLSFYRSKDKMDFSDKEMEILEIIKSHLALRLSWSISKDTLNVHASQREMLMKKRAAEYNLTERESEIILLLLGGKSTKEICEKLFISANTLKKHTVNIYKKLEINKRVELFKLFYDEVQ